MASTTYSTDPALYIYTSLTAGSSHIVTATSRLETILRANRVPFKALDIAVDEKARMIWGRRAGKDESGRLRKLPGLVQEGFVLGDLVEIEEWNEYGELKQHVKIYYDEHTIPNIHNKPKDPPKPIPKAAAASSTPSTSSAAPPAPPLPKTESNSKDGTTSKTETKKPATVVEKVTMPIRSIADEAAQKAKELRLQSLREKVHGSKAGKDTKEGAQKSTAAEATGKDGDSETATPKAATAGDGAISNTETKAAASAASLASAASASAASSTSLALGVDALQSPSRGTWGRTASAVEGQDTLQSPTTARWKSTDPVEPPITSHRGSRVALASQEEIEAIEKAEAIPEVSSSEEEDDEDDDEDEDEAEDEDDEGDEKVDGAAEKKKKEKESEAQDEKAKNPEAVSAEK